MFLLNGIIALGVPSVPVWPGWSASISLFNHWLTKPAGHHDSRSGVTSPEPHKYSEGVRRLNGISLQTCVYSQPVFRKR